jgi:hypothetical protein
LSIVPEERERLALESCAEYGDERPAEGEYPYGPGHLDETASLKYMRIEENHGGFDEQKSDRLDFLWLN